MFNKYTMKGFLPVTAASCVDKGVFILLKGLIDLMMHMGCFHILIIAGVPDQIMTMLFIISACGKGEPSPSALL